MFPFYERRIMESKNIITDNSSEKNSSVTNLKKITGMAMFTALAVVATLVTKWAQVMFLTFDAKDSIITIAAFVYGPLPGIVMSFLTSLIETLTFGGDTGWYGFLMNFLSSAIFSFTASFIYLKKRTINGAIIGLYSATAATTIAMLLLNMFVTPLYFGLPILDPYVMGLLPTLLLPFNFAKALMNSAIVAFLYKPLARALKKAKLASGGASSLKFNKNSVAILISGGVGVVISIAIFAWLLISLT